MNDNIKLNSNARLIRCTTQIINVLFEMRQDDLKRFKILNNKLDELIKEVQE